MRGLERGGGHADGIERAVRERGGARGRRVARGGDAIQSGARRIPEVRDGARPGTRVARYPGTLPSPEPTARGAARGEPARAGQTRRAAVDAPRGDRRESTEHRAWSVARDAAASYARAEGVIVIQRAESILVRAFATASVSRESRHDRSATRHALAAPTTTVTRSGGGHSWRAGCCR